MFERSKDKEQRQIKHQAERGNVVYRQVEQASCMREQRANYVQTLTHRELTCQFKTRQNLVSLSRI